MITINLFTTHLAWESKKSFKSKFEIKSIFLSHPKMFNLYKHTKPLVFSFKFEHLFMNNLQINEVNNSYKIVAVYIINKD